MVLNYIRGGEHSKGKRAVSTQRAFESIIRELEKLAPGNKPKQREILEQSIRCGYQDVYPLKDKKTTPQGKPITAGRTMYAFERDVIESGKYANIKYDNEDYYNGDNDDNGD